jgi:hypothetical protein
MKRKSTKTQQKEILQEAPVQFPPYEAPRQTIEPCHTCGAGLLTQTYSREKGWEVLPEPITAVLGNPHKHDKGMEIDF